MMEISGILGTQPAAPLSKTETAAPGAEARSAPARDVVSLAGAARPDPATASAEQLLAQLHERGLVESASRELPPGEAPKDETSGSATISIEMEAPPDKAPKESEWRPYLPPSMAEPSSLLSGDGTRLLMTLYGMPEGGGGLLDLGALALGLDPDGALLAQLLDGSFRLLSLNQGALDALFQSGEAKLEAFTLPAEARPNPAAESEAQTADPAPWASRLSLPEMPESAEPDSVLSWASARAAAKEFEGLTARWLAGTERPLSEESRAELQNLRREWVGTLEREDPVAFRAWLDVGARIWAEQGEADRDTTPENFTAADLARWTARSAADYASEGGGQKARSWLQETFPRLFPASEPERLAALVPQWSAAAETPATRDESAALARWLADYAKFLTEGSARYDAPRDAAAQEWQRANPEREKNSLEDGWKRRRIGLAVDGEWSENLRDWLGHVDGWRVSRCRDYVNARAQDWTAALMAERPAGFRYWLASPVRHAASTGWFNGATGAFPIETLPHGFTEDDCRRWLRFDILDYL
ncbi:MAG: hypothetical protein IJ705_09580 [Oscillospiraceae bacterium]|nr:hypothetical protein [Oscillospiraceae bacterium]